MLKLFFKCQDSSVVWPAGYLWIIYTCPPLFIYSFVDQILSVMVRLDRICSWKRHGVFEVTWRLSIQLLHKVGNFLFLICNPWYDTCTLWHIASGFFICAFVLLCFLLSYFLLHDAFQNWNLILIITQDTVWQTNLDLPCHWDLYLFNTILFICEDSSRIVLNL